MKRSNTRLISDVLKELIVEDHLEEGLQRVHIFDAWETVICELAAPAMGPEDAARLTSRKFFRDGVLTCTISSSTVRAQLRFQLDSLREKVNARLGSEVVTKIVLV